MASVKIQPSVVSRQSSGADSVMPIARVSRRFEDAEGVDLTDAGLDGHHRGNDQPAIEARRRDDPILREKSTRHAIGFRPCAL